MAEQGEAGVNRRALLAGAGGLAMALGTLSLTGRGVAAPRREKTGSGPLPDIQFDIAGRIGAPRSFDDGAGPVLAQLPPVFTVFTTATLHRAPGRDDQHMLTEALDAIEAAYPFSPAGVMLFIGYGVPYFGRLRNGLVAEHMPRLRDEASRYALEEAVPAPTDVPHAAKRTYNIPVKIEHNDILLTLRSDHPAHISDVLAWLGGSNTLRGSRVRSPRLLDGLATVTSSRTQFVQIGLPKRLAHRAGLAFAASMSPDSPMWMGFLDQQVSGSGPAAICTFAGNRSARLTTARAGDYFDNGSVQHLSHVIEDLDQFYRRDTEPYLQRVQYMFRSNPVPSLGHGAEPAFLDNIFQGRRDAEANARGHHTYKGERRMGHLCALQRSSRAADGTPMHIRMDGPGFDTLDVPDGSRLPKLHFTILVPTAEFFRQMRVSQAALDLAREFGVAERDNGVERFITTTRRQNFLVPPRRHRAFPLAEFTPR